ncbi:hypothetical protein [Haloprofundus salinisoli]|uniref:hypothetical protein n=1 Tax=Haloprofundus salinisoli TaxID=2876193 RepID=UPI001CCAA038|nr:hypothetical protein [Haloprofundus salinisoli]
MRATVPAQQEDTYGNRHGLLERIVSHRPKGDDEVRETLSRNGDIAPIDDF